MVRCGMGDSRFYLNRRRRDKSQEEYSNNYSRRDFFHLVSAACRAISFCLATGGSALLLPVCGERAGVRGRAVSSSLAARPHPDLSLRGPSGGEEIACGSVAPQVSADEGRPAIGALSRPLRARPGVFAPGACLPPALPLLSWVRLLRALAGCSLLLI